MKKILLLITIAFTGLALGQSDSGAKKAFEISNLVSVNSAFLDFGTSFLNDGIVFTSTRNSSLLSCKDPVTKEGYADIFFAKEGKVGNFSTPQTIGGNAKSKFHDGVPTFNVAGDRMIISRSNISGKNTNGTIVAKLYESKLVDGVWSPLVELPFNSDDFSCMHPAFSPDEKTLYFASNRPGGKGGMDIYASSFSNGQWGTPVNLGTSINSGDNEVFPFVAPDGTLFFSSNGHGSVGGLDIFAAGKNGMGWDITHLPAPVNTEADDLAFAVKKEGMSGYFSSDREGGAGKDDIYQWKYKSRGKSLNLCTRDDNSAVVTNADVVIIPKFKDEMLALFEKISNDKMRLTTDREGKANVTVFPSATYDFVVSKSGHKTVKKTLTGDELLANGSEYCFTLIKDEVRIEGTAVNKTDGKPLKNAKIVVVNECTGKKSNFTTDAKGYFQLKATCGCKYSIHSEKTGFSSDDSNVTLGKGGCKSVKKVLKLAPAVVEKEIYIKNIYYDFDKSNIRPDAAEILDHVAEVMQQYPSMTIKLDSHTDIRGSNSYNDRLSDRRVISARDYLIAKGIAADRMTLSHEGEMRPLGDCGDDVDCDEAIHQKNRRTEITVTSMPAGVKVIYVE